MQPALIAALRLKCNKKAALFSQPHRLTRETNELEPWPFNRSISNIRLDDKGTVEAPKSSENVLCYGTSVLH